MDKESVVLISGSSSGIGLALAREFVSCGCRLFATARKPEVIEPLKKEKMETTPLDAADTNSIETCVREIIGKTGRIDMLVNTIGEAATQNIIGTENSIYCPLIEYIKARAVTSQKNKHRLKHLQGLVNKLSKAKIPKIIRFNKESTRLPLWKKLLLACLIE